MNPSNPDSGVVSDPASSAMNALALQRSEEELLRSQLITENIPIGLHLYHLENLADDRTLRMVYANPAVKRLTGLGPEDIVGKTLDENFPGLRAKGIPQRYAEVVRSQVAISFEDITYGDERVLLASFAVRAFPLPGNHVGIAFENITERKQVEQKMLESEARFRSLTSLAPVGIYMTDANGQCRLANARWLEVAGLSLDEALGDGWKRGLHPDDRNQVFANWQKMVDSKGGWGDEYRFQTSGGKITWVYGVATALYDAKGDLTGYVGVNSDITERKQAEESLSLATRRAEALLELPLAAETLDEASFMQRGQELAEELTGSQIAFIHFVHDDQETIELVTWSRSTLKHYCKAAFDSHYPASKAGVWADALRQRVPVVINDYANYPKKRGLPEGHAHLERMISVPVIEGGLVRMITGVGNKPGLYSDLDVETVRLIGETIWRIVSKKRMRADAVRQLAELQQWYEIMLGREERVLELKREADALRQRLGEAPRYAVELAGKQTVKLSDAGEPS